jgi:tetratricopeptide (TPR) repeat protein
MKSAAKYLAILILFCFSQNVFSFDANKNMELGNKMYNEGLYDSALVYYQEIANNGLESAVLYYNMGNAYFKNNSLPSAILYFEKARKLAPNDEDVLYNLGIANTMIVDKIEKVPELFYKQWWNYFYNVFDANTWAVISIIFWIVLLIFVGVFILAQSRGIKKTSFYLGLLFLFLMVATFGLASQKYYYTKEQKEAIIFTPTVTAKSSPTQNAVDLFVVHEGTKITIMDEVQDWVKIKIPDGSIGWLPADSAKEI